MPYLTCARCSLRSYSAARYTGREECPGCGAPLRTLPPVDHPLVLPPVDHPLVLPAAAPRSGIPSDAPARVQD